MQIFREFRRLVGALEGLSGVLAEAAEREKSLGPALDRLTALETSRHQFNAEIEGLLLRAEGKLKAAANAEARERTQRKAYDKDFDPFPKDRDAGPTEAQEGVQQLDAAISEGERLQALRLDVAPNNKALAQRAKWGMS